MNRKRCRDNIVSTLQKKHKHEFDDTVLPTHHILSSMVNRLGKYEHDLKTANDKIKMLETYITLTQQTTESYKKQLEFIISYLGLNILQNTQHMTYYS